MLFYEKKALLKLAYTDTGRYYVGGYGWVNFESLLVAWIWWWFEKLIRVEWCKQAWTCPLYAYTNQRLQLCKIEGKLSIKWTTKTLCYNIVKLDRNHS